jgi:charged multivesicular body protein 6
MGKLFSTKKNKDNSELNAEEKTILQSKITRDNIKNYIKKLEKNSKLKREKAKEALKQKNKDRAKYNLKLSKMYQEQIKTADAQLTMLEEQIANIEQATTQRDAMKVLEKGNEVLKNLQSECNIEKWEKISDDMNDLKEQQDEINQFFRDRSMDDVDDDVEEEMNKLIESTKSDIEQELPSANTNDIVVDDGNKNDNKEKIAEIA